MKQKMRKPSKVYVQNALHGLDALWIDYAGGAPTSHRNIRCAGIVPTSHCNIRWTANLAKIGRFSMSHYCMYTIVLCFP